MCRLIMFNKKGFDLIEERIGAKKLFDILEQANGGHGNGIAYMSANGAVEIIKGVKYDNELVYNDIKELLNTSEMKWCIYHTRIASLGSVTDENCHPYQSGNMVLAMNGTERGFSLIANSLGITDSEAVLRTMEKLEINYENVLPELSSNFLGFDGKQAFATSPNTDWKSYDCVNHDGAIIISSQLPKEFDDIVGRPDSKERWYWNETMELKLKKKPAPKAYVYTNQKHTPWSEQTNTEKEKQNKWRQQLIDEEASRDGGTDYSGKILDDEEKNKMLEIINREKERQQRATNALDYHLL